MEKPRLFTSRRMVLWAGFGGLLGMVVFMAWKGARVLSIIEPENARLRQAYREQGELLDTIRFGLSESASQIRDYLLDRDPAAVARRRFELERLRRATDDAVMRYGRDVPPEGAAVWRALKASIDDYWNALEPVLRWDAETRRRNAGQFLQFEVMPRQRQFGELAAVISGVEEENSRRTERNMAVLFARFRRELILSALLAVALSIGLALITVRRLMELERTAERQFQEVLRARAELQNLSQRLVAAQEEERRRVARELHDEVGQAISAVLVELGRLENRLPSDQSESRAVLSMVRELAERAVAQVRDMALLLRPSMLDDLGLVPALKWQAREISRRTGTKVKVATENVSDDLPDDARTCIYRVVQEALNNAARHARASSVRVDVRQEQGRIRVSIQDDGSGFDASQERGMGILGMEERVKSLGGVFRIDSEKGSGTIVSLLLPVAKSTVGGVSA
ncbi:MAG: sensor histidine kinase [Acidobacteria bacterium]|nr:sensor histidine kinase [Acidobacteriota bacterium]